MIYPKVPENFNPICEVTALYLIVADEFLIMQNSLNKKTNKGLWGIPGGKMRKDESFNDAIKREIFEETQVKLSDKYIKFFKTVYIKYPEFDYVYHMLYYELGEKPKIELSEEHINYAWVTPKDSLNYKLILDEEPCFKLFFKI